MGETPEERNAFMAATCQRGNGLGLENLNIRIKRLPSPDNRATAATPRSQAARNADSTCHDKSIPQGD